MSTIFQQGMTFNTATELHVLRCSQCGVVYAIPENLHALAIGRDFGKEWFCPNGHTQLYTGKSPAQKLEEQLQRERAAHDQTRASRDNAVRTLDHRTHQLRGTKAVVTRIKNRVAKGVCPCCNRYFRDLHSHMANQHPDFQNASTEEAQS